MFRRGEKGAPVDRNDNIRNMLDVIGGKETVKQMIQGWQRQGLNLMEIWERLEKGGAMLYEIKELLIGTPKAKA